MKRNFLLSRGSPLPFLVVFAAVCFGTLWHKPLPIFFPYVDKIEHFASFAVLGLVSYSAKAALAPRLLWPGLLIIAVNLEWLQHYVSPDRQTSIWDTAANVAGISFALMVIWLRSYFQNKSLESNACLCGEANSETTELSQIHSNGTDP